MASVWHKAPGHGILNKDKKLGRSMTIGLLTSIEDRRNQNNRSREDVVVKKPYNYYVK